MQKTYEILQMGKRVGTVEIAEQGLYVLLSCHCKQRFEGMQDLMVRTERGDIRLGLLCPEKNGMTLEKKLPRKELGKGTLEFYLEGRNAVFDFVVVDPEKSFPFLRWIKEGRLDKRQGQYGILFPRKNIADKVENKA